MLMPMRFRPGIESGAITVTFRRWKRPQVVAGNTYRTAVGRLVVEAIDVVDPASITKADARAGRIRVAGRRRRASCAAPPICRPIASASTLAERSRSRAQLARTRRVDRRRDRRI